MMYLPVAIYEVALRLPPEHKELLRVSPTAKCCNWCASSTRLALLIKCISAAQGYINCYLDLPTDEARRVTIIEVSRHIDAILILTRAALGFDTKNFEQSSLTPGRASLLAAADVARYLAASERKMAALVAIAENECGGPMMQEEKRDLFVQLKQIFEFSLNWYTKRVHTQPGGRPKKTVEINAYALEKLDVSPIFWISQGTAMAMGRCGGPKTAETQSGTASSCVTEMAAETGSGMGRLPSRVAEDVDKILHSLGVCMVPETMPQIMSNGDSLDAHISLPSMEDVDSMTISDSSPSAPMVTPESDGSGFAAGDLDPSFGAIPNWAMDQSAELFANIPQSNMVPPWFSL